MSDPLARLLAAVQRACDEKMLMHRSRAPEDGEKGIPQHADDCPGCELRVAYEAYGGQTKGDAS